MREGAFRLLFVRAIAFSVIVLVLLLVIDEGRRSIITSTSRSEKQNCRRDSHPA